MKATGIVRRIDDLGRVVIPKEIRRTMRIREGDPLEIYTAVDGEVIFKKYSPIGEMTATATGFADTMAKDTSFGVAICDRDHVVAAAGVNKREVMGQRLSAELESIMEDRKTYIYKSGEIKILSPFENAEIKAGLAMPIISAGDIAGAVVLIMPETKKAPEESDIKLCRVAAGFLGLQMEE